MKPILGITQSRVIHIIYWKELYDFIEALKRNDRDFRALILSGLFLYLTLEAYITYIIENLLGRVNRRRNKKLVRIWENYLRDTANLDRKFSFLVDVFLEDNTNLEVRKGVILFIKKIMPLRNKIIHTHSFSVTRWSSGLEEKTELASMLTPSKICELYKELNKCIKSIELIAEKIDIEEFPDGLSRKTIVATLKFGI